MGYTHYWSAPKNLDSDAAWDDVCAFVRGAIKEASGKPTTTAGGQYPGVSVVIRDGLGNGSPVITPVLFSINGDASQDLDHETFCIERGGGPDDFCKTARKPYDVVVTAVLAYLAAYYGLEVSSDGDAPDWEAGVALANRVAGKPVPNPMVVNVLSGER